MLALVLETSISYSKLSCIKSGKHTCGMKRNTLTPQSFFGWDFITATKYKSRATLYREECERLACFAEE